MSLSSISKHKATKQRGHETMKWRGYDANVDDANAHDANAHDANVDETMKRRGYDANAHDANAHDANIDVTNAHDANVNVTNAHDANVEPIARILGGLSNMPSPSLGKALLARVLFLQQNPTPARHQPDCKKPGTRRGRVPGTRGLGFGC
ncbi:hypothetical protein EV360DRAFT_84917 [Lentinula raphanica]|nr:hypothetical protein EV360DRAFT_84917 [Lentinula raphanica]